MNTASQQEKLMKHHCNLYFLPNDLNVYTWHNPLLSDTELNIATAGVAKMLQFFPVASNFSCFSLKYFCCQLNLKKLRTSWPQGFFLKVEPCYTSTIFHEINKSNYKLNCSCVDTAYEYKSFLVLDGSFCSMNERWSDR